MSHYKMEGDTPVKVSGESRTRRAGPECYRWQAYRRGLVQLPMAAQLRIRELQVPMAMEQAGVITATI